MIVRSVAQLAAAALEETMPNLQHNDERPGERVIKLDSLAATERLAHALGNLLRRGDVIALHGSLGAGKTAFARALVQGLQAKRGEVEDVPSPTFSLVQEYPFDTFTIWHFDCYRLGAPEEAYELGIEEAFADGVALIEWPERLGDLLPACRLDIFLSADDPLSERRTARLVGDDDWMERLAGEKLADV